ncbi:type II toxin-antitoxin system VapC family toxin [Burkholderiaceae bacterium FT117]|uniref:type II toxin-antitoxin system VapC family toxin n=1 Tax=Zeimonas sediminis TaxID=2944268 RepID=UPI002342DDF8|nr:type II toxin-antitoxin system VapC family toxin [Zeimonas sediminis]MCM5571226.1 type II toxin-antitoxin system VapC family toxin [Zeimonas sediminis]
MRYLLDTNICIYLIRRHPPAVLERFEALARGEVGMSVVTLAELRHGVEAMGAERDRAARALTGLLAYIPAQAFDVEAAGCYGVLAAAVRERRRDALDRLIAAHAIRLDATLVTNNEADFAGYPRLRIENWVRGPV